jgi:hypothetical protein
MSILLRQSGSTLYALQQSNNIEKNDQIPRMASIYSGAIDVLIWLGPGTNKSDEFVDVLSAMTKLVRNRFS